MPNHPVEKIRTILNDKRYGRPGLLVGLVAAAGLGALAAGAVGAAPAVAIGIGVASAVSSLLTNLGATALTQLCDDSKPLPEPEEINTVLTDPEIEKIIHLAILEQDLDNTIAQAFHYLEPDLAELAWKKYIEYIDNRQSALVHLTEATARIIKIISQRRFSVVLAPSQLHDLYKDWLPGNLMRRPELGPILEGLESGQVRKLALFGRPLAGKSMLAAQVAMRWLSKPGRTVAVLRSKPQSDDKESLAALDPEQDLFICDVEYYQAEPLTPEEVDRFKELPCRVVFCQKIGQPIFERQERRIVDYLDDGGGGEYRKWRPGAKPPPAHGRAAVSLGEIDDEAAKALFAGTIRTLFPTGGLTLTDEARQVFQAGIKVFPEEDAVSLLGLARAFLAYAHHRFGDGANIDEIAARQVLDEVGLGQAGPPGADLDEVLRKLFIEILASEQLKVLRVMARWQRFSQEPLLPRPALFAGYLAMFGNSRDLRDDPEPLDRLISTRVLTYDSSRGVFSVWHGKQLELIPDEKTPKEKEKWLADSFGIITELIDVSGVDGFIRSIALSGFCAGILKAGYREQYLLPIMRGLFKTQLNFIHDGSSEIEETDLFALSMTANNLAFLCRDLGNPAEGLSVLEKTRSVYCDVRFRPGEANCLKSLGNLKMLEDDLSGARGDYEAVLPIYRNIRDRLGEAYCLRSLGDLKMHESDLSDAGGDYKAALTIFRDIRDRLGEAYCLKSLGDLKMRESDLAGARVDYDAALPIFRDIRERLGEANCLLGLGYLKMREADLSGVRGDFEAARQIFRDVRDRLGVANCLLGLGDLKMRESDLSGARRDYEAALPIYRDIRSRLGEANCLKSLGNLKMLEDDLAGALGDYEAALPIYRDIRSRQGEANCLSGLGDLKKRESDLSGARGDYEAALTIYRDIRDRLGEAACLWSLGKLKMREDHPTGARGDYEAALAIYRDTRDRLDEANCLWSLGDLKMRESDLSGARGDYEAALPIFRDIRDRLREAYCLQSLGLLELVLEKATASFEFFKRVLEIFKSIGNRLGYESVYGCMASAAVAASALDQALLLAEVSLGIGRGLRDRFGQTITLSLQLQIWADRSEIAQLLATVLILRDLYEGMGDLAATEVCSGIIDETRQEVSDEIWRSVLEDPEAVRLTGIGAAAERFAQTGRDLLDPPELGEGGSEKLEG